MTDMIGYDWINLPNDLTTLIQSFKKYLKKPAPNMNIINDILRNCKKLNKILDKKK